MQTISYTFVFMYLETSVTDELHYLYNIGIIMSLLPEWVI